MSLLSRIAKGLKKITLKKALPFIAGAAAVAIPGVGGLIAGAGVSAASRVASAGRTVLKDTGEIISGAGVAGGALLDTGSGLLKGAAADATLAERTLGSIRGQARGLVADAGSAFGTGAVTGVIQQYLPFILIGGVVLFFVLRK